MIIRIKIVIAMIIISLVEIIYHPILNVIAGISSQKYFNRPPFESSFSLLVKPIQLIIVILELACLIYLTRIAFSNYSKNRLLVGIISVFLVLASLASLITSVLVFSFNSGF